MEYNIIWGNGRTGYTNIQETNEQVFTERKLEYCSSGCELIYIYFAISKDTEIQNTNPYCSTVEEFKLEQS